MSVDLNHLPTWAFVAIPVAFVVLAGLLIRLANRLFPKPTPIPLADKSTPTQRPSDNRGCVVVFGGIFAVIGLATLFFITIRPTYRALQADHWPTAPGQIISSNLAITHGAKGGSSYRVNIHYSYVVDGRAYESNQYDSTGTKTTSGGFRDAKQAAVNAHPPGSATTVHYNPSDAADAMLSTAIPPGTWAFVWFPMIFFSVGVAIMLSAFWIRPAGTPVAAKVVPLAPSAADARSDRRRNFLVILIFAAFWNGVIALMFFTGGRSWCLLPFALIGAALVVFAGYSALQMFNPVVAIQFAHMPIRPGERCEVTYVLSGNFLALRNLTFTLEGREKVTYRQGTNTRSETHVAWRIPLLETTRNAEYERGKFAINLPADVMTSFGAPNNQFTWHLCCRGDIPGRPNIKDDFDVTVLAKGAT